MEQNELPNSILNVTHTHIALSIGDLEQLAEHQLIKSQQQKSPKLSYFYLGKREMILGIIAKFNELEACCQAKSGLI